MRSRERWALIAACACVGLTSAACGKKGPPLTPFINVPAEGPAPVLRRVGNDVYVTVTVPAQNIDGSKPASISRIEVFAATSLTAPPRARFFEIAENIATIPVAPVPGPEAPGTPQPASGAAQGTVVTIRDDLSDGDLTPQELPAAPGARTVVGAAPPPVARSLRRFYLATAYNPRGVNGPPSAIAELPLTPLPDPPVNVRVSTNPSNATITWDPSGGLIGWLLDNVTHPPERPPLDNLPRPVSTSAPAVNELPSGPTTYSVYRRMAADPLVLPDTRPAAAPWQSPAPVAVTPKPVPDLSFSDPIDLDERERCYTVRAVRGSVEGAPSEPVCVTPIDIYPPAVPANVSVIAGEGQATIVWDRNTEGDLGGYIVLRREAGNATLLPITESPISEARFIDRQLKAGVQYFYAVVAVDSRLPLPNMSLPSAEQSDTAR
jgi:hypothetical protein